MTKIEFISSLRKVLNLVFVQEPSSVSIKVALAAAGAAWDAAVAAEREACATTAYVELKARAMKRNDSSDATGEMVAAAIRARTP